MKRILALLAVLPLLVFAQTKTPVQLLNPAGSTAGQAIVSTGPSSEPGWAAVPLTGVTGVLPIANGGTNATTAANARTNLGAAPTASPTFTGTVTTSTLTSNGFYTQAADFAEIRLRATSGANLNGWRIISGVNGASTDGSFTVQHSTDNFASNFTNALVLTNAGSATAVSLNNTPIGTITPAAGAFTTLSSTGTFTPSQTAGIVGTTTNNNANAGSVGEFVSNTATGVSMTSGVTANIVSTSLTAGDWDAECNAEYVPAGGTSIGQALTSVNSTSATLQATPLRTYNNYTAAAGQVQSQLAPMIRFSIASTTTIYCVGSTTFGGGTLTANGLIRARRMR